jgi:hypothetical protein
MSVKYYEPIAGGCFMCLKRLAYPCKYSCKEKERQEAIDELAELSVKRITGAKDD